MIESKHSAFKAGLLVVIAAIGLSACAKKKAPITVRPGAPAPVAGSLPSAGTQPKAPSAKTTSNDPTIQLIIQSLAGDWFGPCTEGTWTVENGGYTAYRAVLTFQDAYLTMAYRYFDVVSDCEAGSNPGPSEAIDYSFEIKSAANAGSAIPVSWSSYEVGDSDGTMTLSSYSSGPKELKFDSSQTIYRKQQ